MADYLSRAPIPTKTVSEEYSKKSQYIYFTGKVQEWPIDNETIRKETQIDA